MASTCRTESWICLASGLALGQPGSPLAGQHRLLGRLPELRGRSGQELSDQPHRPTRDDVVEHPAGQVEELRHRLVGDVDAVDEVAAGERQPDHRAGGQPAAEAERRPPERVGGHRVGAGEERVVAGHLPGRHDPAGQQVQADGQAEVDGEHGRRASRPDHGEPGRPGHGDHDRTGRDQRPLQVAAERDQ